MEENPNVKLKTMVYYIENNRKKSIFNWMTKISKNIYNCTIFTYKIYNIYQNLIYKDLCKYIEENNIHQKFMKSLTIGNLKKTHKKYDKNAKKEKKDDDIVKIEDQFYQIYDKYHKLYTTNKCTIEANNKIIYKYIINDINDNNIIVSNLNQTKIIDKYVKHFLKMNNIVHNKDNKLVTVVNVISSIIKSFYTKNYFYVKNMIENNKHIDQKFTDVKYAVKNDDFMGENNRKLTYRNKIINQYNISKLSSIENFISRLTYKYLGENKEKLPSDVTINIIGKAYGNIKSYYALLKSGTQPKVNLSKFLDKNAKFNLFYYFRSFKRVENAIRLNVGEYVNENYLSINENSSLKSINVKNKTKYYSENMSIEMKKELVKACVKINKKSKNKLAEIEKKISRMEKKLEKTHVKINDKYVKNENLYSFNYVYLPLPKKIRHDNIKLIDIKPTNDKIKICITYEKEFENQIKKYDMEEYENLSLEEKLEKTVSVDAGTENMVTIYDPTGKQYIIKGSELKSINSFYNMKIDKLNSINKKTKNINTYKRKSSLLEERNNKINGLFNRIINKLVDVYSNKEVFIFGYNAGWKTNVNMGRKNNRNFYQIPYKKFITKLDEKLKCLNKKLLITKESYTSKCDALNLEQICYHENYSGKRIKRGLFSSKEGKLINADINGAINIMRKKINLVEIKGKNLLNPKVLKIK